MEVKIGTIHTLSLSWLAFILYLHSFQCGEVVNVDYKILFVDNYIRKPIARISVCTKGSNFLFARK